MQNPIPKLRQSPIISEKPGNLSEKLKTLTPTTTDFNISCWNFAHISRLIISTNECSEFFLFCLDIESLIKM